MKQFYIYNVFPHNRILKECEKKSDKGIKELIINPKFENKNEILDKSAQ